MGQGSADNDNMAKIYSDYQREVSVERVEVGYNALTPDIQANPDGTLPSTNPSGSSFGHWMAA